MSSVYDQLDLVKEDLDKCMKCGNCMAVCPVFITEKMEGGVARGKISLAEAVLKGDLDLDDEDVVHKIFNCLICKSCMMNCPCGVKFDRIILALRAEIARRKGLHPLKRLIFGTMLRQPIFDLGLRVGALFQPLIFKNNSKGKGFLPRFPMGLSMKRVIPSLSTEPFRSRVPEVVRVDKPKLKVAFFTGCSTNYITPQVGVDTVEVLKENGVEVIVPKDQQCCGIALFAHGDVASARLLARKNLDVFDTFDADYIVTACGSCGGSWQHEFVELTADDPVYAKKAVHWSTRTYDISTFLTKVIDYRRPKGVVEKTVTYHDPCHLKKSMNVFKEPREIMTSIPGITLKEMSKPDACCGMAGSFSLTHYNLAMEINSRKIADINKTGVTNVITGCPGCTIQLADGINQNGCGQEVGHFISLLAESYRKEKSGQKEVANF